MRMMANVDGQDSMLRGGGLLQHVLVELLEA
jgi:hypothetical protein